MFQPKQHLVLINPVFHLWYTLKKKKSHAHFKKLNLESEQLYCNFTNINYFWDLPDPSATLTLGYFSRVTSFLDTSKDKTSFKKTSAHVFIAGLLCALLYL